jgi:hypothetical protein
VDRGDHARTNLVTGGLRDKLRNRLPGGSTKSAKQRTVVEKIGSQELRHRERPQTVTHFLDDLLAQQGTEEDPSLGRAGGAEAATGTGEGKEVFALAGIAEDTGEATLEVAAVEEGVDDLVDETTPATAGRLESLLPQPLDLLVAPLDQTVQR